MCCINNNDVNTSFNQCFHTTWCISTCTYRSNIMTGQDRLVTVREGESKENIQALLQKHRIEKVLVVGESNELKGLITVTDFRKAESYPNSCKDDLGLS
ncbi:CBS domain-containing protein [Acinetobacter baumannii]|uniref:CBS domain-containing protein n=3 Tax=Acinetobacter baumannii TaxID=470 RepID=UPI00390CCED9